MVIRANLEQNKLVLCSKRMRLSDNFKLSYGVRVDVPVWEDGLLMLISTTELFHCYKLRKKLCKAQL
jgi:hypothetical protein